MVIESHSLNDEDNSMHGSDDQLEHINNHDLDIVNNNESIPLMSRFKCFFVKEHFDIQETIGD